jgi:hypothetical protein
MTANSFGFFLRGVVSPLDFGSHFISSGTMPAALVAPGAGGMEGIIPQVWSGMAADFGGPAVSFEARASGSEGSLLNVSFSQNGTTRMKSRFVTAFHLFTSAIVALQRSLPWQEKVSTGFN